MSSLPNYETLKLSQPKPHAILLLVNFMNLIYSVIDVKYLSIIPVDELNEIDDITRKAMNVFDVFYTEHKHR